MLFPNQDDVHGTKKSMSNQTDWSHLPEDHTRSIQVSVVSPEQKLEKKNIWSRWIETYQIKEESTWQDFPKSQTLWMFLTFYVNTFQWI